MIRVPAVYWCCFVAHPSCGDSSAQLKCRGQYDSPLFKNVTLRIVDGGMFRAFTGCRTFATCAVLLEHNGTSILKSNAAAIKAAKKLAGSSEVIGVAVMKKSGEKPEMSQLHGLSKLITVDVGSGDFRLSEQMASILADVHKQLGGCITHWLTPHSSSGKDLFPRLASVLEAKTAVVADITEVLGENSFKRPIYAGKSLFIFCIWCYVLQAMRWLKWKRMRMR